jgi:penicillin-binding protein 1A
VPLVGLLILGGTLYYVYSNLQIPDAPPLAQTTQVFDRNGDLLTTFHAGEDRKVIPFDQMPQSLRDAVIDTEDKNFYSEGAISPLGILRAAWTNLLHGSIVEGGSTITQQYVKNVYTGGEQTFTRKIKEAMLAMKLEKQFPNKDDILAKYLNTIYFGHGAYGVQAAAKTYFGKDAKSLKPVESALLAALIAAPSALDPLQRQHRAAALLRRNYVIDRMVEEGHLDPGTAAKMKAKPLSKMLVKETTTSYQGAFFAWYVRGLLEDQSAFGEKAVTSGGLRVRTTLDPVAQDDAEAAVADQLSDPEDPEAALVAIDPATGEILAMVGGRSYTRPGQFNLATQGKRPAGSSFKAFTLTAALKQGISLNSYWNGPSSYTIPYEECYTGSTPWTPSNADPGEAGTFSLISATAYSVNTVFAQLEMDKEAGMSPEKVAAMAHRLGVISDLGDPPPCSLTLGSQNVSPLEMTSAYATLANEGVYQSPTPIMSVRGPSGDKLRYPPSRSRDAVDPNIANAATYALQAVVQYGTGTGAAIDGLSVAGKTGTSQDYKNAWFCGFTPPSTDPAYTQVAACVWVGYPKHEKSMYDVGNVSGPVYGGTIPASIWHEFVSNYLADEQMPTDGVSFTSPDLSQFTGGPVPPPPSPKPSKSPVPSETPSPRPRPSPSP